MFEIVLSQVKKSDNISVKMNTLNKWVYEKSVSLKDKNSIFHTVQCNYWNQEIGKFYLTTNRKMEKYTNKVCIFKKAVIKKKNYDKISHSQGFKKYAQFNNQIDSDRIKHSNIKSQKPVKEKKSKSMCENGKAGWT